MKLFKVGLKLYYSIFLIVSFLLIVSNPLSAAESEADSQTTRQDSNSSGDSTSEIPTTSASKFGTVTGTDPGDPKSGEAGISADSVSASVTANAVAASGAGKTSLTTTDLSLPQINTYQFTGAAMANVPILVPPGRNGIQPNLNLSYNSYGKNSWLGVGWSLDVGAIQRATQHGVDYGRNDFVVIKDGSSSELVERSDWGAGYYGAKIEGGFARYQFKGDEGWEVTTKDGTKYFYGRTAASRQDDPEDSSHVFKWCLERVEDTNGNYMTVAYAKDQGQIYLDQIAYTGNGSLSPANTIKFHLQERDDAPAVYTPYFAVRTAYRLKTIEIVAGENLVRAYQLIYDADPQIGGSQYSDSTGRSLLSSVQQYGSDALVDAQTGEISGGSALPPLVMETIQWPDASFFSGGSQKISGYGGENQLVPMDLNGDGRTDFVIRHDGGTLQRYISDGQTFDYAGSQSVHDYGTGNQLVPLDINGDGRMDFIIRHDGGTLQRYVSDGNAFVYVGSQTVYGYGSNNELVPMDINGDGRMDFIIRKSTGKLQRYISDGQAFDYDGNQTVYGYNKYAQLVPMDINGDGRMDFIIRKSTGKLQRYISDGQAFDYDGNQTVSGYNSKNQLVPMDINGDGRMDFTIRKSNGKLQRYISDGQAFDFDSSQTVAGYGSDNQLVPLDINGDGRMDFIIRHDGGTLQRYISYGRVFVYFGSQDVADYNNTNRLAVMDIDGNGNQEFMIHHDGGTLQRYFAFENKTDLLDSMTNGLGATTRIEYTASSGFENKRLPLIVHPVSKITIDDGLGNFSISKIKYSGGVFDPAAREFRGFKTVIQINAVGTPHKTITESKFHQDAFLKGRQYQIELKEPGENGVLLSKTTFTWDKVYLDSPDNTYAFVKLAQKDTESYDGVTVSSQEVYTYDDSNGNLLSKTASGTNAEDVIISYQYSNLEDWLWRKTRETVEGIISGKVREAYYDYYEDGTGNLRFKEFWLDGQANPKIEMTYDAYGNQKTVIDPRGNPTTTDYDIATHTYPLKIIYPATNGVSHIVENEAWDYRFGKVTVTKDENNNRTDHHYDAFGRPVQVDLPNGGQAITAYHDDEFPGYVVTKVKEDASGSTIDAYQYVDGLGREIQTITFGEDGKSIVTKKFYDALGRNDLNEGPFFSVGVGYPLSPSETYPWQQTTFDIRGRPEAIESADGEYGSVVATFSYSGLSITVTDPDGGSKTENKDYLGRVIQVVEHAEQTDYFTDYTYNVAGDLLAVKDHAGNLTSINYDTLGRKISMNDPDMGYWEYTYDANGNLLTQIDEKLQTVIFAYDKFNRITAKTYSTSDPTVTYAYDNLSIANGRGRLYSMTTSQATSTYNAYDEMGNVTSVSKTIIGDASVYTTRYAYDLSGKVTQTIYPDNFAVSNTYYPGSGLLQTVSGSDGVDYARLSGYAPTGKIGSIEHANGVYTDYTYDAESTRLTAIVTSRPGPAVDLQNKRYQYTPAGDIQNISDAVNSIDYHYAYDRLHRLIEETNTGSFDPVSYTYNAIGNIMSKTVGDTTLTYAYGQWHKHAVKSISFNDAVYTYNYDENGNMIEAPDLSSGQQAATRSITYNADNMPVRIHYENGQPQPAEAIGAVKSSSSSQSSSNATVSASCWIDSVAGPGDVSWTVDFFYDGQGVRVKKHVLGGSQTYYIGAHYEIKDGVAAKYIFAGNLRVAMIKGAEVKYFHKDHLGSSTVMTDTSGAAVESTAFMPFGAMREHSGPEVSNYKFTDQEFDVETGLYNYNARLYDPLIGRFISPDPIVQAPFDPQTLNRYSYCRNNPLIYIDPSGHFFGIDNLLGAIIGAFTGAVKAAIEGENIWQGAMQGAVSGLIFSFSGAFVDYYQISDVLFESAITAGAVITSKVANDVIFSGDGGSSGDYYSGSFSNISAEANSPLYWGYTHDWLNWFKQNYPVEHHLFKKYAMSVETEHWPRNDLNLAYYEIAWRNFDLYAKKMAGELISNQIKGLYSDIYGYPSWIGKYFVHPIGRIIGIFSVSKSMYETHNTTELMTEASKIFYFGPQVINEKTFKDMFNTGYDSRFKIFLK